jgi:hypothetical protein
MFTEADMTRRQLGGPDQVRFAAVRTLSWLDEFNDRACQDVTTLIAGGDRISEQAKLIQLVRAVNEWSTNVLAELYKEGRRS